MRIPIGEVRRWERATDASAARPYLLRDGVLHWPDGSTTEGADRLHECMLAHVAALPPARKRGRQVRVEPSLLREVDTPEARRRLGLPMGARVTDVVGAVLRGFLNNNQTGETP